MDPTHVCSVPIIPKLRANLGGYGQIADPRVVLWAFAHLISVAAVRRAKDSQRMIARIWSATAWEAK